MSMSGSHSSRFTVAKVQSVQTA